MGELEQRRDGGILDDTAAMERADPGGMLGLVAGFPDQVAEAWRISRGLELPWEPPEGGRRPGHGRLGHRRATS